MWRNTVKQIPSDKTNSIGYKKKHTMKSIGLGKKNDKPWNRFLFAERALTVFLATRLKLLDPILRYLYRRKHAELEF